MTYVSRNEYGVLTDDDQRIPYDESNADYREYLEWVALGNSVPYVPFDEPSEEQQFFDNICLDASMVHGGVNGSFLFNNDGMLGERITTGSGSVVLNQGPLIINPTINTPTITGNLYVGSTPYQGDANSVLTATGTGVEWNFSSGIGDVVRNITPTITGLELVGTLTADGGVGTSGQLLSSTSTGVEWASLSALLSLPILADGRLTLASNTPVVQPNASSATTLYYTPYLGNRITLYNGTVWAIYTFSQLSIAVPATSNTNYDVFVYDNSGTLTLDLTAWTNDTTRATALTTQDGVLVKTGATTQRYIGTVRTDPTSGQISDTPNQRHVWNMHNRVAAHFYAGTTGNYTYTTATWRAAGGSTTLGLARVQWVCGQNTHIQLINHSMAFNTTATNIYVAAGIGIGQTAGNDAQIYGSNLSVDDRPTMTAYYDAIVTPGYQYAQRVEISAASGTTTWYSSSTHTQTGMRGTIFC
jgi:hypothetical protein